MSTKLRLMIVDDEPIVGKRLKRLLEKEGYHVETFTDGFAAIEELTKKKYDIVITDLKMDHVDGIMILETAKANNPEVKVIIITGFGKKETSSNAFKKGAFDFIIKPFKFEELLQVIKKAGISLEEGLL
ncbi:MAG: response regulator [Nitrospirae bacterium]|nr:response regulator [Nitrospirota bacterium]